MANHIPTIIPTQDGHWIGSCTCRWRAPDTCDSWQSAEDSNIKHLRDVERVRANQRKAPPSLKQQRDYFAEQAQDATATVEDARLWQQLADEISRRLNEDHPPSEGQSALW